MISVLDASVGVKWFLDEGDCGPARALLEGMGVKAHRWIVPELFFFEVYSVCMRRHPDPSLFANEGMKLLMRVPLARVAMTDEMAREGSAFVKLGLTGYDAVYASLAKLTDGIWVTYDKKAAQRLRWPKWIRVLS